MATISLCLIVKNEETVLARCLESVQGLFDETIIVEIPRKKSQPDTLASSTPSRGTLILLLLEIFPFPKQHKNIFFGWMLTMCSKSHIWQTSFHGKKKTFKTLI